MRHVHVITKITIKIIYSSVQTNRNVCLTSESFTQACLHLPCVHMGVCRVPQVIAGAPQGEPMIPHQSDKKMGVEILASTECTPIYLCAAHIR